MCSIKAMSVLSSVHDEIDFEKAFDSLEGIFFSQMS